MTRDRIISNLFTGKNFNECLQKMEPAHLRDDLKQEVILIVCEQPEQRITDLYSRNQLEFFVVRIILNLVKSNTSPFARKYRRYMLQLTEVDIPDNTDSDRQHREDVEDMTLASIDSLYWYNAEMVRLYGECGNYRAIEKLTRIPYISCYQTIKKSFQELRSKVEPAARVITESKNVRV